jgi:hypothetical protein
MQKNEVEKEISELKIQQQYLLRAGDQNDNLVKENKKTAHNINIEDLKLLVSDSRKLNSEIVKHFSKLKETNLNGRFSLINSLQLIQGQNEGRLEQI